MWNSSDVESGPTPAYDANNPFSDKAIRNGFIRKVYGILAVQLGLTFAMCGWFMFHDQTRQYIQRNVWMMFVALIVYLVVYCILICCQSVTRSTPANYILLGIFVSFAI